MDFYSIDFYFWGIAAVFAMILVFALIRISSRVGIAVQDQSQLIATGAIGTPIAEFIAPGATEYAEAVANDEAALLDEREDITERVM